MAVMNLTAVSIVLL